MKGSEFLRFSKNVKIIATSIVVTLVGAYFFQGCSQTAFKSLSSENQQVLVTPNLLALHDCRFIGVGVLQSRIRNYLLIPEGDVTIVDANGNPTTSYHIATDAGSLGVGNPSLGMPDDLTCTTPKFKAAMAVMIDACAVGMTNANVRAKLFPNGANDLSVVFYAFNGRAPTTDESAAILELTTGMNELQAETAACAVSATTLESLISI